MRNIKEWKTSFVGLCLCIVGYYQFTISENVSITSFRSIFVFGCFSFGALFLVSGDKYLNDIIQIIKNKLK